MASIIDSIKSVNGDNYALFKLATFSTVNYLIFNLWISETGVNAFSITIWFLMLALYLGFVSIIISNRINQRLEVLPLLNPFNFIKNSINSTIIIIPFFLVSFYVIGFVVGLFNFESLPQQIAVWMVRFCVFCTFICALINYAEKQVLFDAFNLKKIMSALADVIVYTIIAVIGILIFYAISFLPLLYLVYTFFKFGVLFKIISFYAFTLAIAILSDFWGQLHFDISSRDNYY